MQEQLEGVVAQLIAATKGRKTHYVFGTDTYKVGVNDPKAQPGMKINIETVQHIPATNRWDPAAGARTDIGHRDGVVGKVLFNPKSPDSFDIYTLDGNIVASEHSSCGEFQQKPDVVTGETYQLIVYQTPTLRERLRGLYKGEIPAAKAVKFLGIVLTQSTLREGSGDAIVYLTDQSREYIYIARLSNLLRAKSQSSQNPSSGP